MYTEAMSTYVYTYTCLCIYMSIYTLSHLRNSVCTQSRSLRKETYAYFAKT